MPEAVSGLNALYHYPHHRYHFSVNVRLIRRAESYGERRCKLRSSGNGVGRTLRYTRYHKHARTHSRYFVVIFRELKHRVVTPEHSARNNARSSGHETRTFRELPTTVTDLHRLRSL